MKRIKLIALTLVLIFVLELVPALSFAEDDFTVTISMEGLTLGQGMYVEPAKYTLSEINTLVGSDGYGPFTEADLTAAMVTLALTKDKGIEYEKTGSWDSNFYLSSVKDFDTGTLNIPTIIGENGGPTNNENDGNSDDYLGEFDYGSMSGWMITVDNSMIPVGAAEYNVNNGDAIRWQFTLHGYGADLGFDTGWGTPAYFTAANKDALYKEFAILSKNGSFASDADAKSATLAVMTNLTATQAEVDSALGTLKALSAPETPRTAQDVSAELNAGMAKLATTVTAPAFGTSAGEWSVLCLARGDYYNRDNAYLTDYYSRIVDTVNTTAASVNKNGALHSVKSTENSRLILALSAIGRDATSVGEWNLIAPYEDFTWIKKQGINGPVFALIALDSHGYATTDTTIRQQCIDFLLAKKLTGGGWALSGTAADPDMTAMTLQALAPYKAQTAVSTAIDEGIAVLSSLQNESGGYSSWGTVNSESISQVIVAMTALGINPDTDSRFVKNGKSAVDALLAFYDMDANMFCHVMSDGGNGMATDQGIYALVAYKRFTSGQTSLYDMSDVTFFSNTAGEGNAIAASISLPKEISNRKGTVFNAAISLDAWASDEGYKLLDCIVTVPAELRVTGVTAGERLSDGEVLYNYSEAENKLRIVYGDFTTLAPIALSGAEFPAEILTVNFEVKETIDKSKVNELNIALSGMSLKKNSDSTDETAMTVVNSSTAYGTVSVVNGISFSATELYRGDGIDLIPESKMAVAISVTELKGAQKITYKGAEGDTEFVYNTAMSEKTGIATYVAIVASSSKLESFAEADNYTVDENVAGQTIVFGDTNGDGTINAQDALNTVNAWLRKSGVLTNAQILSMNINADTRINTFDALGIAETVVNGGEFAVVSRALVLTPESTPEV